MSPAILGLLLLWRHSRAARRAYRSGSESPIGRNVSPLGVDTFAPGPPIEPFEPWAHKSQAIVISGGVDDYRSRLIKRIQSSSSPIVDESIN